MMAFDEEVDEPKGGREDKSRGEKEDGGRRLMPGNPFATSNFLYAPLITRQIP
jgi:hypothetical protein